MAAMRVPLVLLACGSFNPITNQHMRLFELARDHLHGTGQYKVVGGIVSPVSDGYGKQGLVLAKHRVAMAKLALQSSDWVSVDDWESQQPDWTETVVTLRSAPPRTNPVVEPSQQNLPSSRTFQSSCTTVMYHYGRILKQYQQKLEDRDSMSSQPPNPAAPQLKLLCGADFLDSFSVPGLWLEAHVEELAGRFGLVCVSRGALQPEWAVHRSDTLSRHRQNIFLVREWIRNEISATEVRRGLRRGQSVRYLVPDSVLEYVQQHHLYTHDSETLNQGAPLRPLTKQASDA
ncbi:nicotinamide/nicotinic acid mononucleotide adenylyltransferase 3 isoform X1 [Osmerus mordax]|uniref:nicotinamide/nicotinic acid mononucleotide adenylyltransferase 3 isoform X1 n=1 Tax=Osmerus mordax TaxID=8014 RepID=UPI00350F4799